MVRRNRHGRGAPALVDHSVSTPVPAAPPAAHFPAAPQRLRHRRQDDVIRLQRQLIAPSRGAVAENVMKA